MQGNEEGSIIKLLKIVFAVVAVVSFIFVFYNIALYTDGQDVQVSAGLQEGL
jgi:hypothetical protein